jgi:hypothetical protein
MARGYNSSADILTKTKDGRDLNALWAEYQAVITEWNSQRSSMVQFLTYPVVNIVEEVPVIGSGTDFELASEYGVPKAGRPTMSSYSVGFPFDWYDLATRFTWQFLADATQEQVDANANAALEADNRLVFNKTMRRLFDPANTTADIQGNNFNVYAFWNADGNVPPDYRGNTFTGSHTHYMTTNGATLDAQDLDDLIDNVGHHGYTPANGFRVVVMINKAQSPRIRAFRSAASNGGVADATHGNYDFIPSLGTAAMLLPQNQILLGTQVGNTLEGFNVIGSYGDVLIVEDDYIPSGYLLCFATGGPDNLQNPLGVRQHANPELQGMRLVKGPIPDYPLIDAYYIRGFGLGVRHRGAAAIMQIVVGTTYTQPATYSSL